MIHQHRFRARVQSHGYRLDTYTGGWFWDAYVDGATCGECAASRLYLSRYAPNMGPVPRPWTKAAVWQWTDVGSTPGVPSTFEDQDVLVGTETLADLIYHGSTPPPPPVNGDLPVDQQSFDKLMDNYVNSRVPDNANIDKRLNALERWASRIVQLLKTASR